MRSVETFVWLCDSWYLGPTNFRDGARGLQLRRAERFALRMPAQGNGSYFCYFGHFQLSENLIVTGLLDTSLRMPHVLRYKSISA
jgi:hypothetical protein